ncbi:PAS domain S-box protein [Marinomonas sp. A79]|uniref:histidine kinase n=1 Tax=Marinomonas vulgaris TaxID=2823372 RepID=A0ABS5HDE9_9GAMM|nr:PAS domain S-box protein [Marinomonas vulgaris]MBR7889432.1 PAS domain S-box protein [Marinomonas vulgaris]
MSFLNNFFITQIDQSELAIGEYNYLMVILSILLASGASFFALHFTSLAHHIVIKKYRNIAFMAGSLVMAGGIWSMHFVGMLAFDMGHGIHYDPVLTTVSLIPSVLASYITLKRLTKINLTLWQLLANGVLVGGGIGTMHYIGMEAMEMSVELKYDPFWFSASIIIAVLLAFIALSTHYHIRRLFPKLGAISANCISALIMGGAIAGMHYAGMAGARFITTGTSNLHHMHTMDANSGSSISFIVTIVTIIMLLLFFLALNIVSQLRYRQLLLEKTTSEVRLKTTLDTAVDGVVTIDSYGIIKEFNKAATTIFGWHEDEVLDQSFDILFTQHYIDEFKLLLGRFNQTGESSIAGTEREICAIRKNGDVFPIRLGIGRVDIPGGDTLFVGFITDISTRKALEDAIKKSEKQYSSLIKNIPGASFRCLINDKWTTKFVSDAIQEVAGWCTEEFYNHTVSLASLIHPDDDKEITHIIDDAITEHKNYAIEYRLKHKNGHYVWVFENGSIIYDEDGQPEWIDGVILDISARVEMEEELRDAKNKAEASAESKASFLANMSHEIRTPMNAIIGFSDILLDSDVSSDNKKHLSTISKSARSLLHLLNDILDSAKLDKNKLELDQRPFVLASLVDNVVSTLWLQARSKGLELSFCIDPTLASVYLGAEDRIRQVLMNILGNAIKFTKTGRVSLTLSSEPNNMVRFVIEDSGIGIPKERVDTIFDPFTQADASMSRRFGGTGLGTSISKQLVNLMGGDIRVTSEIGVGSRFTFDLPLVETALTPDEQIPQALTITPKRVLIADDIEQNLTLLTLLLEKHQHEVFLAKDGHDVIKQFKTIEPDIILMDIQMPNMDGLTATQIIRTYEKEKRLPHTPIIALTANVLLEDKLDAEQAGMDGFANKPIEMPVLIAEMARVLNETPTTLEQKDTYNPHGHAKYQQIHLQKGLTLWKDMPTYLTELERFQQANNKLVDTLTNLATRNAFDDLRALAHAVKGTSGNLALLSIANGMMQVEQAALGENAEQCKELIEDISALLAQFSLERQHLSASHLTAPPKQTDLQTHLSRDDLLALVDSLITSVNFGELDDDNIELLIQQAPLFIKPQVIEASEAISDFDFNHAVVLLTDLKILLSQEDNA